MITQLVHFSDKNTYKLLGEKPVNNASNNKNREKMKAILYVAINNELTDKQRKCIVDFYLLGKKKKDIADEMGVHPATVSKHISYGEKKLRHIAQYYM